jgi:hypothetical protein
MIKLTYHVGEKHPIMENLMNTNKTLVFLTVALILLVSSACSPAPATETATVAVPTKDPILDTSIAETAQAGVLGTLTQMAVNSIPTETPTPLSTATASQTAIPIFSPTSGKPMISVVVETLCRLGPDKVYDRVGALGINTMAEVYALDPSRQYYFIANPNNPGTYCWVWGFYATPVNSFTGIPVYTPAYTPTAAVSLTPSLTPTRTGTVTPTPNFTITNPRIRTCGANMFLDVTVTNTGGTNFLSGSLYITDTAGPAITGATNNTFIDMVDCTEHYRQGDLIPGEVGTVSTDPIAIPDLHGHQLTISVTVCPQDNLAGTCSVKSINYKP